MEISVAGGRAENDTVITHNTAEPQNLRRECLHHHDRVRPHAVAVVEFLRHSENKHVVFLLCPVHVGSLIRNLPRLRHHLFRVSRENRDLPGFRIQNRVTAEERMSHLLFHVHADLVELMPHERTVVNRCEIRLMHDRRNMVRADAFPVRDSGRTVLVSP